MEESWKLCLEEELLCPICLNVFEEPIQLPCKHNFCQTCISQAWAKVEAAGAGSGVRCPECCHEYEHKPCLERNLKLANIVERYNALNTEKAPAALHCVLCRRGPPLPVTKVCLRCKEPMCQQHVHTHLQQPGPGGPGHLLVGVEELRAWTCPRHEEYRTLHCQDEQRAVCQFCCISRCAGQRHAVRDVDTQRLEMQRVLMRQQERLDARVHNIDEQLCKLDSDQILVKDAVGQLKERVRAQYRRMAALLDEDLKESMRLLDSVHGAYRHGQSQQALGLRERQQEADRLLGSAQTFCQRAEDINFMKNTKPYQLLMDRSKSYLGSSLPPHKVGRLNSHLLLSELTKREQSLRRALEEPLRDSSVLQIVPSQSVGSGSGDHTAAPEPEKRKHGVAFAETTHHPGTSAASQDLHGGSAGKRPFLGDQQRLGSSSLYPSEGLGSSSLYPSEGLSHQVPHHILDSSAQQQQQQQRVAAGLGSGSSSHHHHHSGSPLFPPPPTHPYPPSGGGGGPSSQYGGGRKILVCSLDNCYCSSRASPATGPPRGGPRPPAPPYPLSEAFPWGVGSQEYPPHPPLGMREWLEPPPQTPRHPQDFYRLYGQASTKHFVTS